MRVAAWDIVRMRRVRTLAMAMIVTIGATLQTAALGIPAALDQAPTDAQIIVVVPNMKGLSDKIAKLQAALQIPSPEMGDVLGALKAEAGMTHGIKDDGALLLVITDLTTVINGEADEPPMAVAIEVTDYAAFVGNFQGNAGEAVTKLTMPHGDDGFAKKVGNFAVIGPDEAVVTAYAAGNSSEKIGKAAGKLGEKYLGESDAAMYIDLQALAPLLKPKVKEGYDEMVTQMKASVPAEQMAMMQAIFAMYFEAIDVVLTDGQAGVYAFDLSDDGVGVTLALQAKSGSTMAKYFPGAGGKPASRLSALPKQPYLFAMGMDLKAFDFVGMFERVLAKLPADAGAVAKMYKDAMPMMKMTNGIATAWFAPPAGQMMMGPGMLNMVNVYDTTDGAGYMAATKDYMTGLNNVQMPLGLDEQAMTFTTAYNADAMKLEGVSVDQFSLKMQVPPEMMQQMGPMLMMMGGLGYDGLIGAKGDKVVMTTSVDAMTMTNALTAVDKADGLGTDAGITATRAKGLPPSPAVEMYVSVEGILNAVNPMVQMFAGQALPVPQGLSPITMGMGVDDGGFAGRMYLPIKTMQGIMETAQAVQGAVGGGVEEDGAVPPPF